MKSSDWNGTKRALPLRPFRASSRTELVFSRSPWNFLETFSSRWFCVVLEHWFYRAFETRRRIQGREKERRGESRIPSGSLAKPPPSREPLLLHGKERALLAALYTSRNAQIGFKIKQSESRTPARRAEPNKKALHLPNLNVHEKFLLSLLLHHASLVRKPISTSETNPFARHRQAELLECVKSCVGASGLERVANGESRRAA